MFFFVADADMDKHLGALEAVGALKLLKGNQGTDTTQQCFLGCGRCFELDRWGLVGGFRG